MSSRCEFAVFSLLQQGSRALSVNLCRVRLRMTSMRDGLILHDFPFENELDEVLAYLKSLDCVYLEDLICARTLGVQPCMFLLSMAAMDFLNDLVIK